MDDVGFMLTFMILTVSDSGYLQGLSVTIGCGNYARLMNIIPLSCPRSVVIICGGGGGGGLSIFVVEHEAAY